MPRHHPMRRAENPSPLPGRLSLTCRLFAYNRLGGGRQMGMESAGRMRFAADFMSVEYFSNRNFAWKPGDFRGIPCGRAPPRHRGCVSEGTGARFGAKRARCQKRGGIGAGLAVVVVGVAARRLPPDASALHPRRARLTTMHRTRAGDPIFRPSGERGRWCGLPACRRCKR